MKRNTKITLVAGAAAVIGMLIPIGLVLHSWISFDRWVDGRLHTFAEYSYDDWKEIHDACAELAESREDVSVAFEEEGWEDLPEALQRTEARRIWLKGGRVTLRFSGGHARYLHIG